MRINTAKLRSLFKLLTIVKQRQLAYFSLQLAVIMNPTANGSRDPLSLMTSFGILPNDKKT